jgi:flavin-dependent dehydrogenase
LIISTPDDQGWFWYIPLKDNIVSVGTVGNKSLLFPEGESRDIEEAFSRLVSHCKPIASRLHAAERQGKMRSCSDFSYTSRRIAGNGYVLIGDAFGFIDPVYSSGVFLALKSGELAADTIHQALLEDDLSGKRLSAFAEEYIPGVNALRNLVYCFYNKDFRFSTFLKANPQFKQHLVDLLTGNVYRDGIHDIFSAMQGQIELPPQYEVDTT